MKAVHAPDFENLEGIPKHTEDELAQLEKNVLADPEHEHFPKIPIWQCGKEWIIVDGNNQHKIRSKHNLKIKYLKLDFGSRLDALAYAYDCQAGRRNVDASRLSMAISKRPKSARGPKPAGKRAKSELPANLPETRQGIAKQLGISERTLRNADKVREKAAPAVAAAVEGGQVSVSDAASIADLTHKEQEAALKKVASGEAKTLVRAASKPPEPPKDQTGKPLPANLVEAFAAGKAIRSTVGQINKLVKEIIDAATSADGITHKPGMAKIAISAIQVAKKDMKAAIEVGLPHAICPYCRGRGCKECDSLGWVHKDRWNGIPESRRCT